MSKKYNCCTRTEVRGSPQEMAEHNEREICLTQKSHSFKECPALCLKLIYTPYIIKHLPLPITLYKPTEERLWCPQQLQEHHCSEGGWLWGGVTVCKLPSEHTTDSLLEQIPVPAQKTATFRSSSDCFHADTNKGTHLTLSQGMSESRHHVYASNGSSPSGITRIRVRSNICNSYARRKHNKLKQWGM